MTTPNSENQNDDRIDDSLLSLFARLIERADTEISMTITIPGATISGRAISYNRYLKTLAEAMKSAGEAGAALAEHLEQGRQKLEATQETSKGSLDGPDPVFLHMTDVQFVGATHLGGPPMLYRIRLDQVVGFSLSQRTLA